MELSYHLLANDVLRLEPLDVRHEQPLRKLCDAAGDIWSLFPYRWSGDAFDDQWERVMGERKSGILLPFAVITDLGCGGMTGFLRPDAHNASVEIGGTFYSEALRGTAINPAAKWLLLEHAFCSGARRVQFMVDALNSRSRAAVIKLGAKEEGVLRQDRKTWSGRIRDTVVYSILAGEWPGLRTALEPRFACAHRRQSLPSD